MLKKILLETPNEGQHFEDAHGFEICPQNFLNTLRTGDADLRFYITTVQDG